MTAPGPADRIRKLQHDIECLERRELELRYERALVAAYAWHDGMTQADIAAALNVAGSTISCWSRWCELVELARAEIDGGFLCSWHSIAGLANGDYTNDEICAILERALGWASKPNQVTELDVWEAVCRDSSWRRKYGSVPGYLAYTRKRRS